MAGSAFLVEATLSALSPNRGAVVRRAAKADVGIVRLAVPVAQEITGDALILGAGPHDVTLDTSEVLLAEHLLAVIAGTTVPARPPHAIAACSFLSGIAVAATELAAKGAAAARTGDREAVQHPGAEVVLQVVALLMQSQSGFVTSGGHRANELEHVEHDHVLSHGGPVETVSIRCVGLRDVDGDAGMVGAEWRHESHHGSVVEAQPVERIAAEP